MSDGPTAQEQASAPHATPAVTERRRPMETRTLSPSMSLLSWLMDDAVPLLGGRRVGIDGFLSLIPGVGDAVGFAFSVPIIVAAVRAGASVPTIIRIAGNALGETLFGMVPVAGPVVSFVWKANQRNIRIVERELADHDATTRSSVMVLAWAVGLVVLTLALFILGLTLVAYGIYRTIRS